MLIWIHRSIDLMIIILETMGMMWRRVQETGIVAVGASQPGVASYRHDPVKKSRRSKRVEWNVRWLLVSLLRQLDCMLAFLDLCDETF